jgi:hypothetical protein
MLATLAGLAISWYFGFTPVFIAGAALSFFFPRLFKFLFWLFTFPFILALGATTITLLASLYDIAPLSTSTFHTSLYIASIPSFLLTGYLSKDVSR